MAIIETDRLTKRFNGLTAVEELSLEVSEREILAFLGPNGAGKTTTIRLLSGIISPTSGSAVVCGQRTDLFDLGVAGEQLAGQVRVVWQE